MFNSGLRRVLLSAVMLVGAIVPAFSQVGIGAGISAMGADVRRAAEDLGSLSSGDSLTYGDVSGGMGLYAMFRIKYSYGGIWRFAGDAAYNFFPAAEVKVVEAQQNGDTISGTFDIGATLITGSFGLDITIPVETIRPYISGQLTYTIFNRTFARVDGSEELNRPDFQNKWSGSNEWGLAFGVGMEFPAFSVLAVDAGARYNLANFLTQGDTEPAVSYLQIGATLFFGDLLKTKEEKDKEEDERLGR